MISQGITSNKTMSHLIPLGIDIGFFGISFPLGWFCINKIGVTLSGGYESSEKLEAVQAAEKADNETLAAEGKGFALGPQA